MVEHSRAQQTPPDLAKIEVGGVYASRTIGVNRPTSGIVGRGTLALTAEGLRVQGYRLPLRWIGAFVVFGLAIGCVTGAVLAHRGSKTTIRVIVPVFGMLGVGLGAALGRVAGGRKPVAITIPARLVSVDALRDGRIEFVSYGDVRGEVRFVADRDDWSKLEALGSALCSPDLRELVSMVTRKPRR